MTAVKCARGAAFARAALAGNPSDGYGGAVLAVTVGNWSARAQATPSSSLTVAPANRLVEATVRRFGAELSPGAPPTAVRWSTSIPQRVGLGSSSALVIAVTRALCELHGVELGPSRMADFALAVEVEDLGIVAGLQDRVAQAYGGLTFMDFSSGASGYEQLDPELLPPLVIAWRPDTAAESGHVHDSLRERHRRGDPAVQQAIAELAAAARGARGALLDGDLAGFGRCVDRTFDLRREMVALDHRCVEMIEAARAAGASANYTGSGGAIVAVCADQAHREAVAGALGEAGCEIAPGLAAAPDGR